MGRTLAPGTLAAWSGVKINPHTSHIRCPGLRSYSDVSKLMESRSETNLGASEGKNVGKYRRCYPAQTDYMRVLMCTQTHADTRTHPWKIQVAAGDHEAEDAGT